MKQVRLLLILMSIVAVATSAFAQGGPPGGPGRGPGGPGGPRRPFDPAKMADFRTKALTKELGLTTAQQPKVKAVILNGLTSMKKVLDAHNPKTDVRAEFKKTNDATTVKIKKLLTAAQVKKYDAYIAKQKAERAKRGPGGPGGPGGRPPRGGAF